MNDPLQDRKKNVVISVEPWNSLLKFDSINPLNVRCHMPFMHAFSALRCVFRVLTLIEPTNVITLKMQRNAKNACANRMWQLGLKSCFDLIKLAQSTVPQFFNRLNKKTNVFLLPFQLNSIISILMALNAKCCPPWLENKSVFYVLLKHSFFK